MIGPPKVPPNMFQRTGAVGIGARVGLKLFAQLVGIQDVIPEKFPDIAVKTVGAGLDGGANNAAHEMAEFGWGIVGDEVEFFDGVRGRE